MKKEFFVFPETQYYREYLEVKHLKGQNKLVVFTIFLMMVLTVVYLAVARFNLMTILSFSLGYIIVLAFNFAASAYSEENFRYLKFSKYITSITFFTLIISMIVYFQSPSLIPLLFVAYAISSIYKDIKVLLVLTVYFLFTFLMLLMNIDYIFDFQNNFVIRDLAIGFFVILFILVLLLSSFIMVKEKTFFYNNIAYAKEKEYRNLDLLLELKLKNKDSIIHQVDYYQTANKVLDEFSVKIGVDNIFTEKIEVLQALENKKSKKEILKQYPNFKENDLLRLERLLLNQKSAIRKLILKIKHTHTGKIKTREIFSGTHFQSFNKQSDSIDIKIVSFVIYYVALRKGLAGMKSVSNEELFNGIINSDLHHFIDPKVVKIFKENADVFNTIVDDAMNGGEKND